MIRRGALLATLAASCSISACAAIWGFQDATDLGDASVDAGAEASPDARADVAFDQASDALDGGGDGGAMEAAVVCPGVCVAVPPAGWAGPFAIAEQSGGPPPPALLCAAPYPSQVYQGFGSPSAPDAICSCACGAPDGGTCSEPVANYFNDNFCMQPCGTQNQLISACTTLAANGCNHFTLAAPVPEGGACAPSATVTVPDAGWTTAAILCGSDAGMDGCEAGLACTPRVKNSQPLEADNYCIEWTLGSPPPACPAAYPKPRTYYGNGADTRGCTPCTCGAPSGASCATDTVTFYSQVGCVQNPVMEPLPSACTGNFNQKSASFSGGPPTGGSCAAEGGTPVGAFTPSEARTICCTL